MRLLGAYTSVLVEGAQRGYIMHNPLCGKEIRAYSISTIQLRTITVSPYIDFHPVLYFLHPTR